METHQYISECLTNLVFSQIARKCDISSRDLNRDLNLNLKPKGLSGTPPPINRNWLYRGEVPLNPQNRLTPYKPEMG